MSFWVNKCVLLGVTGGIAAYKSAELVRRLKQREASVHVVLTEAGKAFINPLTLQAVSGERVRENLFDLQAEGAMSHIEMARMADLILIAPASANVIAQLAHGLAPDLLTTLCLATTAPIAIAPAMNQQMWLHPATVANIAILKQRGVQILGPGVGEQACGEFGPGRMLEPLEIMAALEKMAYAPILQGLKILITAGPTREAIDPVRYLSNQSSGKMGFAMAEAAVNLGAEVTLIAGPVLLPTPANVKRIDVQTAAEMLTQVMQYATQSHIFVGAAAVTDYRVSEIKAQKIKRGDQAMHLDLIPNADIIASVAKLTSAPFTVAFAAESQHVIEHARAKRQQKKVNMVIVNDISQTEIGFDSDNNEVTVIACDHETRVPIMSKRDLAYVLWSKIMETYRNESAVKNT